MNNFNYPQYGFNRNNYIMPNYNQQQYFPQQPIQQTMPIDTPIQYVGYANLKEVEAHILMPNAKAIFYDKANNMYYEKICNNDGQSFIKQFKQVDFKGDNTPLTTQNTNPTIDLSNFVKKSELGAFVGVEEYNKLLLKVEQLQKQIMGGKNNGGNKQ